jgi:hypothetical protein
MLWMDLLIVAPHCSRKTLVFSKSYVILTDTTRRGVMVSRHVVSARRHMLTFVPLRNIT